MSKFNTYTALTGATTATDDVLGVWDTSAVEFKNITVAQLQVYYEANFSYITASSTETLTNKSGAISQWTNDSGYITGYTETDTLDAVTGRGNTTTNAITTGVITATGGSSTNWNTAYTVANAALPKAGGTMTGALAGRTNSVTTVAASNDTGSFSVRGDATYPASMSFHRAGAYAVNFGLSTANKMELGGWSASTIKHTWDMVGNYTAVGDVTAYSDIRVKTNIERIPNALNKVCQISGYTFDRTDYLPDPDTGVVPDTRQSGVIAQEVLEVLPEVVTQMDDGKYAVAYGNMVGLLIEAIKELKAEVEGLKNGSST